jgi:argininosuccinate lyase
VGNAVESGEFSYNGEIQHTHEGSLGNLCTADIRAKMERIIKNIDLQVAENAIIALTS